MSHDNVWECALPSPYLIFEVSSPNNRLLSIEAILMPAQCTCPM